MISEKLKDSEDSKMSSPFTEEEIHILKKICDNPIFKTQKTFHILVNGVGLAYLDDLFFFFRIENVFMNQINI